MTAEQKQAKEVDHTLQYAGKENIVAPSEEPIVLECMFLKRSKQRTLSI